MQRSAYHRIPSFELEAGGRNSWAETASKLNFPTSPTGFHAFQKQAREIATLHLRDPIAGSVWAVRERMAAGMFLSGLPLDSGPLTPPPDRLRPAGKQSITEAVLVGITSLVGDVYGYRQDRTGPLVHQIAPLAMSNAQNSADGSGAFGMHVDKSVFPPESRPEWLALYGLVNDAHVPTRIVFWEDVLRLLNSASLAALERQEFLFPQTDTLSFGAGRVISGPGCVLEPRHDGAPAVRFAEYSTQGTTRRAEEAITAVREALRLVEPLDVEVAPGSLLLLNNRMVLHGRGMFSGRRWLQRVYAHSGIKAMHRMTGSLSDEHVFDARVLLLQ